MAGFFPNKDPYPVSEEIFYCNADGDVQSLGYDVPNYQPLWDTKLFFTVNMTALKRLSFTAAKLIDACWDTIVGRGGQMLMAMLAYRVVRRSMTLTMETCDLALSTVTSIYCQQLQFTSVWQLLRNLPSARTTECSARTSLSLLAKTRLLMQIAVCVYVMAFATLVSVTTGYSAGLTGVYGYADGQPSEIAPISQVTAAGMVLTDGGRVGLSDKLGYPMKYMPFDSGKILAPDVAFDDLRSKLREIGEPFGVLIDCK